MFGLCVMLRGFFCFFFWLRWVFVVACGIFFFLQHTGSSLQCMGFSLVVECTLSLSSCGAQAPGYMGSVVGGTWALLLRCAISVVVVHRPSCPAARGILAPQPGMEPASPTLEGGLTTTGPPGKSLRVVSLLPTPARRLQVSISV